MPRQYTRTSPIERFWSKVHKTETCWLWTGYVTPTGYGMHNVSKTVVYRAHRYAWQVVNGEIPDGLFVCHRCDVRNCVRPDHLFLGTHAENMSDRNRKGRQAKGKQNWNKVPPKGERNPAAQLTWNQVREIRVRLAAGESCRSLGRIFGVSKSTISAIRCGHIWNEPNDVPGWTP